MTVLSTPFFPVPLVREDKPHFAALPAAMREKIAQIMGESVLSGTVAYGGLSASAGYILTLESGRRVFAKGSHPEEMAHGTANLRQEAHVYLHVPVLKKISPAFIGTVWDGDEDGWLLGLWDCVDSSASVSAERAIALLQRAQREPLAEGILPEAEAHNYLRHFLSPDRKWKRLRDEPRAREQFLSIFVNAAAGAAWLDKNLSTLISLQEQISAQDYPRGLLHGDLRLDNFLFAADRAYMIDWPNACRGPLVFDALFMASNIEGLGGAIMEDSVAAWSRAMSQEAVLSMLAAIAGFFADQVYRVSPPKLPRLRWMQRCMFLAQMKMLARAGKIESIPDLQAVAAGT